MPRTATPSEWVTNRILAFFNRARNIDDLLDGTIKDDPADGPGYTLGRKLAGRILRTRNALRPIPRFRKFEEFDSIPGVGPGTIDDLVYTFGTPAAEAFRTRMYTDAVIYEANWPLEYFRYPIANKTQFQELAANEEAFHNWVAEKVGELCGEREVSEENCSLMQADLGNAYVDTYHNTTPAPAYALALWFYEFDADNWFSWERIQEACHTYFDHHGGLYPWEMQLRFFKGFTNRGIIQPGITPDDLPVVVNWPEQCITLWFSALYD